MLKMDKMNQAEQWLKDLEDKMKAVCNTPAKSTQSSPCYELELYVEKEEDVCKRLSNAPQPSRRYHYRYNCSNTLFRPRAVA